ncbi:glycosyltransferase family A protein [Vitiosangium sp. GDMCC 1.1324]|uniref:glycosyltransferase family A protein n=1 Tax=Vitiosangium sp. (strain GDMCC 1.1324) TaxID=2138576 RepID=UPI000D3BEF34|nr:glycosyltransferase family A protein [Vitiosangium sp. GDMCC 1.1324]PTL76166.1 glycosyltransferase family 2 protein [Vitiosangium sp. GDMCC 1.1324]
MRVPAFVEQVPLHAWVLEQVEAGARVLLLAPDAVLAERLVAAGCSVLALERGSGPDSPLEERLAGLAPSHVVLPGEVGPQGLEALLRTLSVAVPSATLLLGARNAASSTALLEMLSGQAPVVPGVTEESLARCFAALGLKVLARREVPCQPRTTTLATGTEAALRGLLAQLAPRTESDVLLYALAPAGGREEVASRALVPELLSVVLWAGETQARPLLDEALFSLACQEHQPLEILLVTPQRDEAARELLERYQAIGGYTFELIEAEAGGAFAEGARRARGRYLAFLDAACVVYPDHYVKLVQTLREGPAAWAVSRARRTPIEGSERFVPHKRPLPLGEHLEPTQLYREPSLLFALVVDRSRLGPFPLERTAERAFQLPLRLAALFEPAFLGGIASCEQRFTGSEKEGPVDALPELRMLTSLGTVEERVARARADGASAKGMRHRVIDELNNRFREGAPRLHGALKSLAGRLVR